VGYGADPRHCIEVAMRDSERCIAGNHDLGASGRAALEVFSDDARSALEWTRAAIGRPGQASLERLSPEDTGGAVPLFHGSPRDPVWEYVLTTEQARAALEDRRVALTLVGHTHVPFSWRLTTEGDMESPGVPLDGRIDLSEGRWLVNPGAVGQPRDGDARAAWALYHPDEGAIEFRRTPYDVAAAQNAILEAGLPPSLALRLAEGR
jgi:diadenosine tetraphosphatase ApaH/serine/threonine PP2A family protein phosphatase